MSATPETTAKAQTIPVKAWWILALMTFDYVLGMIDRNTVSVLKTTLKSEFDIGDADYSVLVTAFMIPYALFYVVCGRIVDAYGSRWTFTIFVAIWSCATIGAGLAQNFQQLVVWRAVLGAAEAGLLPATIFALVTWFPRDKIATVYAIKNPLQALGPILSPPLIAALALAFTWRWAFIAPGALGLLFALIWWLSDRNPPDYGAQANAPPSAAKAGFIQLLQNPVLWGILLARMITDPVWFFFQNWQAGYLQEVLGLSLGDVGRLLWIPPLVNTVFMFASAGFSDHLIRKGWAPARSRLRVILISTALAPLIAILPFTTHIPTVIALMTATYVLSFTWLYLSNILTADLFPKGQVASAIGLVNCVGTVGATVFNAGVGRFIELNGYMWVFIALAVLHPIGALVLVRFYRGILRGSAPSPAVATGT